MCCDDSKKPVLFIFHPRGIKQLLHPRGMSIKDVIFKAKRIMDTSVKAAKKQVEEKDDVAEAAATVEETVEEEESRDNLAVTVLARDRKWQFWLEEDQPLSDGLFDPLENLLGGKCMLHHQSATRGPQLLDRTKTPSFYGMIFDDVIFLGAVIRTEHL